MGWARCEFHKISVAECPSRLERIRIASGLPRIGYYRDYNEGYIRII